MEHLTEELAKGNLSTPIHGREKPGAWDRFLLGNGHAAGYVLRSNRKKELELQGEKKTLVLSLTHDIKTPLSAIRLYVTRASAKKGLYTDGRYSVVEAYRVVFREECNRDRGLREVRLRLHPGRISCI